WRDKEAPQYRSGEPSHALQFTAGAGSEVQFELATSRIRGGDLLREVSVKSKPAVRNGRGAASWSKCFISKTTTTTSICSKCGLSFLGISRFSRPRTARKGARWRRPSSLILF